MSSNDQIRVSIDNSEFLEAVRLILASWRSAFKRIGDKFPALDTKFQKIESDTAFGHRCASRVEDKRFSLERAKHFDRPLVSMRPL
jgi:hypothetical protein